MPTIEERALALVNKVKAERGHPPAHPGFIDRDNCSFSEAICRALETLDAERAAHAQFRQEVSDAVEEYMNEDYRRKQGDKVARILSFILPKPVDPLVEVQNLLDDGLTLEEAIVNLGLKLVEVGDA